MADMEPVFTDAEPVQVLSTPAFSSNDPATEGLRMVPIDDNPPADDFADSDVEDADENLGDPEADPTIRVPEVAAEGAVGGSEDDGSKTAGEWVAEIDAAQDQDSLDGILERYSATGKDFKTVSAAAEARQAALDADNS
jgi:hypothetical protein